ncbi:hypothetical protein DRW41_07965 [Neobacillus piezotolerans]|uniref:Molybdopterin cofactor biosynthesis MoaD-related C-terminal domain-containing protein n=1 Tax=Neobacillus piezotolerans TaxID=2259171 RepID=A0A3D8GTT1_9BACI|nr:hypothetical protein [Neobacillus piezotolerans]RDU37752.1 hypothetical protein DRW41_07965 [Neobacillus piezotolerans]
MKEAVLEFRGINRRHLEMYFEELGGVGTGNPCLPKKYTGGNWSGEILSEKEIAFTSTFKVNSVLVRFRAETEEELAALIKSYRYKTTRVGG